MKSFTFLRMKKLPNPTFVFGTVGFRKIEFKNTQTLSESDVKQRIAQLEQEKAVVNFVGREF